MDGCWAIRCSVTEFFDTWVIDIEILSSWNPEFSSFPPSSGDKMGGREDDWNVNLYFCFQKDGEHTWVLTWPLQSSFPGLTQGPTWPLLPFLLAWFVFYTDPSDFKRKLADVNPSVQNSTLPSHHIQDEIPMPPWCEGLDSLAPVHLWPHLLALSTQTTPAVLSFSHSSFTGPSMFLPQDLYTAISSA